MTDEISFKAKVVQIILRKEPEEALGVLSKHYGVDVPGLKVGLPKKFSGKLGVYVSQTKTIHVMNRETFGDPFVIIHEFYHHLRTRDRKHRGTEKYADKFAEDFIRAYYISLQRYHYSVSYGPKDPS